MTENVHECLTKITEGLGPDVVIEAVGSPATYVMAVNEVGFTGRVVCIGYAKSEVSFQTKYFVQKNLISADHVMHCPQISEQLSATWNKVLAQK